jgi:uncharacterized membrane protein (DUF485 family)
MSSLAISLIAFACIFGGMLFGVFLRAFLPAHHVSDESKEALKLGIGMIATLAALVLGLLVASAKGTFDTMNNGLKQTGSRIVFLDRVLAQYGLETKETRDMLRQAVASSIELRWPEEKTGDATAKVGAGKANIETVQDKLRQLSPRTDAQHLLQSQALKISDDIAEGRWLLIGQMGQSSIPIPFLIVLVFWLTVIFATFGLFSPRNPTVIVFLIVCALSVAGSLFLIMELDTPYAGLIKVSSAPLHYALAQLGK